MKWEKFGMLLLDTKTKQPLTLIQQENTGKPLVNKCQALLELWNKSTANPKWEQVIGALKKMILNQLATQLETALRQEQQGKVTFHMNS